MSKKSDKSDASNKSRGRRRAERNRLRTIKHIHKLLDQIVEGAGTGFNHHGWCNAANSLKQASAFLEPTEQTAIGDSWRLLYAENGSNRQLVEIVERVKERIAGNLIDKL